ncbi:MAG: phosphonate ABC transporter, permease protein PhnE [Betaproteobacteria bacterium]|nr:phosphonate ABC transporter, permease protein PhnE [Betaproteobacteria bacterium]MBV9360731.1 phosphonate ABC transporter, permease protein PhnE [Betaproteobacteria bacterium]
MAARTGSSSRAFPPNWAARAAWLAFVVYFFYAASHLELTPARFMAGLEHGGKFVTRLFPPDFHRWQLLAKGMIESLQIAVLASALGVLISAPLALCAARNLMPAWATWPARAVMVLCRSFHPVIVAILFVKAVGFGALAGILALTVASVGFLGKLMTEAIEEISLKQVEAVRATGAPFMSVVTYAVVPQVFSRFVGFVSYETDANLRNSTMVGIVGAGGIGGTLFSAFQRFDYDFVCAIVLTIIALIMIGEVLTARVKKAFGV